MALNGIQQGGPMSDMHTMYTLCGSTIDLNKFLFVTIKLNFTSMSFLLQCTHIYPSFLLLVLKLFQHTSRFYLLKKSIYSLLISFLKILPLHNHIKTDETIVLRDITEIIAFYKTFSINFLILLPLLTFLQCLSIVGC